MNNTSENTAKSTEVAIAIPKSNGGETKNGPSKVLIIITALSVVVAIACLAGLIAVVAINNQPKETDAKVEKISAIENVMAKSIADASKAAVRL